MFHDTDTPVIDDLVRGHSDVFSNRIVGYAPGPRMTAKLAVSALRSAIARRKPKPPLRCTPTAAANFAPGPSARR
jgi:transposase InsO family protein